MKKRNLKGARKLKEMTGNYYPKIVLNEDFERISVQASPGGKKKWMTGRKAKIVGDYMRRCFLYIAFKGLRKPKEMTGSSYPKIVLNKDFERISIQTSPGGKKEWMTGSKTKRVSDNMRRCAKKLKAG